MTRHHERSGRHGGATPSGDGGDRRVGRRSYLRLAGTTAGVASLLAGTAGAGATTQGTNTFSRTVDAVEAGCDPTGRTPCDRAFRRAVDEDTLLSFPAGTYRFTEPQAVLGVERLGIVGEGAVSFSVPPEFNANLLTIAGGSELLFRGITVDTTASGATPGLRLCARDRLTVEDVAFVGRSASSSAAGPAVSALSPVVRSPDGVGIVRDVRASNGGPTGASYRTDDGRAGIRIGGATRGTMRIENCRLEGFPNGGAYVSETPGEIRIDGGVYRNNAVAGIRLGGTDPESSVRNARVEVGLGDSTAFDGRTKGTNRANGANGTSGADGTDACAIRFEGGGSGANVRECAVTVGSDVSPEGAIVAGHGYGGFSLRDTRIRIANAAFPAVRGLAPHGGRYSPPQGSLETRVERCSIVGPRRDAAIRMTGRPRPRVEDTLLDGAVLTDEDVLPVDR
jgi:hypothetical protein